MQLNKLIIFLLNILLPTPDTIRAELADKSDAAEGLRQWSSFSFGAFILRASKLICRYQCCLSLNNTKRKII